MSAAECADKGVQRMRCVLNEKVALRSWKLVPYAYYVRGYQYAQKLSREQFELLSPVRRPTGDGQDASARTA